MTVGAFKTKTYTFVLVSILSVMLVISAASIAMPEKNIDKTKSHGKGSMSYDDKVAKKQSQQNAKSEYKAKYVGKTITAQKEKGMKVQKENPRIENHIFALSPPKGIKDKDRSDGFSKAHYINDGKGMSFLRAVTKAANLPVPENGHHLVVYLTSEGKSYYLGELKLFSTPGKDATQGILLASIRGIDINLTAAELIIVDTKKLGESNMPDDATVILSSKT